jgi:hypothetical protein
VYSFLKSRLLVYPIHKYDQSMFFP